MLLIEELECELIEENRPGFLKGDAMFLEICRGLGRFPLKLDHQYIVLMEFDLSIQKLLSKYSQQVFHTLYTFTPSDRPRIFATPFSTNGPQSLASAAVVSVSRIDVPSSLFSTSTRAATFTASP